MIREQAAAMTGGKPYRLEGRVEGVPGEGKKGKGDAAVFMEGQGILVIAGFFGEEEAHNGGYGGHKSSQQQQQGVGTSQEEQHDKKDQQDDREMQDQGMHTAQDL